VSLKEFSTTIQKLEEFKSFSMANIKGNLKMGKDVAKANFFGIMANIMKGNGKMEKNMEVDIGNQIKEKVT
jgi:hypothetical protein